MTARDATASPHPPAHLPLRMTGDGEGREGDLRRGETRADLPSRPNVGAIDEQPTQPTRPHGFMWLGKSARQDFGDLAELAQWIDDVGYLLHPIVIKPSGEIVAGRRRWGAWPLTRFADQPIPVRVIDIDAIAGGAKIAEYAENVGRKDFTWSEQAALWLEVEPALKEAAKQRQREHGGTAPGKAGKTGADTGRVRDAMTKVTGRGGKSMENAVAIVKAWQADPAKYQHIVDEMNTKGVKGAYARFRDMQEDDRSVTIEVAPQRVRTIKLTAPELYDLVETEYRALGLIAAGESIKAIEQEDDDVATRYAILLAGEGRTEAPAPPADDDQTGAPE